MLKGAIFDFDGTLFDSMFIWDTAGEVYLSRVTSFTICEDTWFTTFRPIILKRKRSCSEKLLV